MSEFRPTESQRAAIETRGSAVLISAGAGSGKTKVLTERLMSRICTDDPPVDLDSFLIITFTRAAAAELRGRIAGELAERLAADPTNKRLRRQTALCQRAQIGTIHSFCSQLLRENCHLLGLSPDFAVVDEERAEAMKLSALERVLDERYAKAESFPGFTQLADTVGAGRDDSRLVRLVLELHDKMQCHARPDQWAERQVQRLSETADDVGETPWGRAILDWARDITRSWRREYETLTAQAQSDSALTALYADTLYETAEALRGLEEALTLGWDRARRCLPLEFPQLSRKKSPDADFTAMLRERRKACKDKDMAAVEKALNAPSASLLRDMAETAPAMEALLTLTLDFDRAYGRDKRQRALVDYSDLEHLTAQLLTNADGTPTELARQISARYTEIMVDEYQDVSRVQDDIFRAISREGKNLFLVGDVKQSIYRFRLADPTIFTEKYESYPDYTVAAGDEPRRILLRENFRSRREVLDAANSVFSLCMSRSLGDVDYDDAAALLCGAGYPGAAPTPELLLIDVPKGEEDEESPDRLALEATVTARRIREMVERGETVTDHGVQRPMSYGDVAILLRSVNSVGTVFRQALLKEGVPVAAVQGGDFFGSVEVSTVVNLLALLDDPHQDVPLIAVLRSPAFHFSADELSELRAADPDAELYAALCRCAETNGRAKDFLDTLTALRSLAPDLSASELTWQLINELSLLSLCSAMSDGERRRADLLALITLSEKFEGSGYRGLHRYVLWLRRLAEKGTELPGGGATGAAVQIMSMHKSKGLEFPVVFLCDTAHRFNREDSRGVVLVHPELGLGPKRIDTVRRTEYPTLARNAIRLKQDRELLSEELRLLYVGMTRAKERLIVTAAVRKADDKLDRLRASLRIPMPPETLAQAQSMSDWLLYAALADGHRLRLIRCAAEEPERVDVTEERRETIDAEMAALVERQLGFRYAHETAVTLPSKLTATELKGRAEADADAESTAPRLPHRFRMPELSGVERPLTGTERGVATHLVLQYMDYAKATTAEGIRTEIERLRVQRFLSDREAAAVNADAIAKLFSSPLGQRILAADEVQREFKFSLLVDAGTVFPDAMGEELLLQGVVDCCIREGDSLTVIDYKTDRVFTSEDIAARAELYRPQLRSYAEALRRIRKLPVRECVLYFLAAGKAVKVEC